MKPRYQRSTSLASGDATCNHPEAMTEVSISPGHKSALSAALLATVNPGDEVIVIEPANTAYRPIIEFVGGTAVGVELVLKDRESVSFVVPPFNCFRLSYWWWPVHHSHCCGSHFGLNWPTSCAFTTFLTTADQAWRSWAISMQIDSYS